MKTQYRVREIHSFGGHVSFVTEYRDPFLFFFFKPWKSIHGHYYPYTSKERAEEVLRNIINNKIDKSKEVIHLINIKEEEKENEV